MKQFFVFLLTFVFVSYLNSQTLSLTIRNNAGKSVEDVMVELPLPMLKNLPVSSYVAIIDKQIVPIEITTDLLGASNAIFLMDRLNANESKKVIITTGNATLYPKRTYAELSHKIGGKFEGHEYKGGYSWVKPNYLRVPDNFRDHAYFIKYEGPGWESDRVAFRFYLDQRNAVDVFAKKTPGIVLPFVGVDGYDSYHQMADWGMDNMKVGKALGIGSIAVWDGKKAVRVEKTDSLICYISADGKLRSQVMTTYYGWDANGTKCNLQSKITIDAGSRASHMELRVDKKIANLATGINKDKNAEFFFKNDKNSEWSYIASFGKQSLNDDQMGLVVFFKTKQLKEIVSDELNHVVVLEPVNGYVDYYFMPTWELDWEPVVTKADFVKCIDEVLTKLNQPVTVTVTGAR